MVSERRKTTCRKTPANGALLLVLVLDLIASFATNAYLVMQTRVKEGNRRTLNCDPGSRGIFLRWEFENGDPLPVGQANSGYQLLKMYGPTSSLSDGAALVLTARRSHQGAYYCVLDYGRIAYRVRVVADANDEIMYYYAAVGERFRLRCADPARRFYYWKKDGVVQSADTLRAGRRVASDRHGSAIDFSSLERGDSGLYQCVFADNRLQNIQVDIVPLAQLEFVDTSYEPPAELVNRARAAAGSHSRQRGLQSSSDARHVERVSPSRLDDTYRNKGISCARCPLVVTLVVMIATLCVSYR